MAFNFKEGLITPNSFNIFATKHEQENASLLYKSKLFCKNSQIFSYDARNKYTMYKLVM
jgi:hypothetical protein